MERRNHAGCVRPIAAQQVQAIHTVCIHSKFSVAFLLLLLLLAHVVMQVYTLTARATLLLARLTTWCHQCVSGTWSVHTQCGGMYTHSVDRLHLLRGYRSHASCMIAAFHVRQRASGLRACTALYDTCKGAGARAGVMLPRIHTPAAASAWHA